MSLSLITPDPEADAARRARLRRMRTLAVSLLVLAAVVYLATLHRTGSLGYVNSGAEASMVGAIADWFAVTALFRHPLGLPIPHTALIPRRKDDLGRNLETFVAENFLQEEVIRGRLADAHLSARTAGWLAEPQNAARVVAEAAQLAILALKRLPDDDIRSVVTEVLIPRLRQEPVAELAGILLDDVVRDGAHHGLVDLTLDEAHRWLVENQDTFIDVVGERAPWWTPQRVNDVVTHRLHRELITWVEEIRGNPEHPARGAFDSFLGQLAQDLQGNPETQARAERLKDRLLEQPKLVDSGMSIFAALRSAVLDALGEADGPLRARTAAEVIAFAEQVRADPALQDRLDGWAADLAVFVVNRYGGELTTVITHTVERWDGREAAERIELHVGPDLQFIRINGTIVGGLVGLIIHAVTMAVGR